jgi:hypothetical protein
LSMQSLHLTKHVGIQFTSRPSKYKISSMGEILTNC